MIHFKIFEARTFYEGPDSELEQMYECLRVEDKNAWFKSKRLLQQLGYFNRGPRTSSQEEKFEEIKAGAKWIKFYDKRRHCFGTGLFRWVKKYLRALGIDFEYTDNRRKAPKFSDKKIGFWFMDEIETRSEQLVVLRDALRSGVGIIHCAPNSGKTEVACAMISSYMVQTGRVPRTLFLIHRKGLAEQTRKRFHDHLGFKIARLGGGDGDRKLQRVTVATTQTADNLVQGRSKVFLDFLQKCDLVVVDELHVNKANQLQNVLNECRAPMRFGLSGTVDTDSFAKMMRYTGLIGPVLTELTNKELVDLGRSARPHIRMVRISAHQVSGSFGYSYRKAVIENVERNRVVIEEALRYVDKNFRTLITVARLDHGRILRDWLQKKVDIPIQFMHGATALHTRKEMKQKFVRGKAPILIASPIFDVGEDLPECQAWVNAAGGKGWELVIQRLGRTMRRKPEENIVYITDFIDDHNSYMLAHSAKRLEYYLAEDMAKIKIIT